MSISDFASAAQIAVPQLATTAAPGSVVESLVSAGRSRLSGVSQFRQLGLAMRFQVEISNAFDLGQWTSCEGLRVEFKYEEVRSGGDYASSHVLPLAVSFSQVTLRRAVESPYSDTVQDWLREVAMEWQEGTGEPEIGSTVTITMLDVYQNTAATWQLQGAFPVSWSGPSMSAKSSEIGSETLVLEHKGFLEKPA